MPRPSAPAWLNDKALLAAGEESAFRLYASGLADNVDCAINANVILYLGESEATSNSIHWIIDLIGTDVECATYYPDLIALYYLVSRAYVDSAPSLGACGRIILQKLAARALEDGSYGSGLLTALAVCTRANFGDVATVADRTIDCLLVGQNADGSWDKRPFYLGPAPYYGSEELTTAFCLEALIRFRER